MDAFSFRSWVAFFFALWTQPVCLGQTVDSFEGGAPRWTLVESDCQAQLTGHEISLTSPHRGRTSELFEVDCSHGTMVLLAYPIEPCAVIDEFQPELWTRCASGGIRIGVRVVFPRASHPVTDSKLTTVLWGSFYEDTGSWQKLRVDEIERKLSDEAVAIRQKFGSDINLDGAFFDCLVLNTYTGPGRYRAQVDDLALKGAIPISALGRPLDPNWRENWRWRLPSRTRAERFWASPNTPPVWLQYRRESLPWVDSLGFSGIVMSKLPTREQLSDAQVAGLSVIAPAPEYPVDFPEDAMPALRGWLLGAALDSRLANLARDKAQRVAGFPPEMRRPLIAEAMEDFFQFSRLADEVIVPQPISLSAGDARDKTAWLDQKLSTVQQRSQGWVSVNLGVPPAITGQLKTAVELLEPGREFSDLSVEPLGFRRQMTSAVLAGAQGFLVRTFRPLEIHTPGENAQAAALRWVRNDLELWGPWITGGQRIRPPVVNDRQWLTGAWAVDQSRLIIAQCMPTGSQFCTPPTRERTLELGMSALSARDQVFRLTAGRIERLETESTPAGLHWVVPNPEPIETLIVTADPKVLGFLRGKLRASLADNATNRLDIVNHYLTIAARSAAQRGEIQSQLAQIQTQIDAGVQALQTQRPLDANSRFAEASDGVFQILFQTQQAAQAKLAAPQSSPLAVLPAALGLHWKLADACERTQWQDVPLPGGTLNNLNDLRSHWSQERRLEEKVDLHVELVPQGLAVSSILSSFGAQAPPTSDVSQSGLRMAAYAKPATKQLQGGYAGASLRIRSAGVPVQAGTLVRVSAMARILKASDEPAAGLLVYDNQVGPDLGQLVRGNVGELVPIELYRFISQDDSFRILAECRGECDVILESIRFSVIKPAAARSKYFTGTVDPYLFQQPAESDTPSGSVR